MTRAQKRQEFRHPDTVAYLQGLSADEAAVQAPLVRAHADGFTRYWLEDGEVRCRDITAAELPQPGGGLSARETLLSTTRERFGTLLPKLTAEAGRPGPINDTHLTPG